MKYKGNKSSLYVDMDKYQEKSSWPLKTFIACVTLGVLAVLFTAYKML